MNELAWASAVTPLGTLYLATSGAGLARVKLPGSRPPEAVETSPAGALANVRDQIAEYFDGKRATFDLPIDWSRVTGFRRTVLETLYGSVRLGSVMSYGDLATKAGEPGAAREVGEIMASNPYPIVVPCHRVVAGDGLGGYGGGLEMKRWLLAHEGVLPPTLDLWG